MAASVHPLEILSLWAGREEVASETAFCPSQVLRVVSGILLRCF